MGVSEILVRFFLPQHREQAGLRGRNLDATEDSTHGPQRRHCYPRHRSRCSLPLLVYSAHTVTHPNGDWRKWPEQELLGALLRLGRCNAAFPAKRILARPVSLLRATWTGVKRVRVGADSDFARAGAICLVVAFRSS